MFRVLAVAVSSVCAILVVSDANALPRRFPEQYQVVPGPQGTDILVVGDVNGDGHPDILSGMKAAGTYSLYLGQGDGTFAPPITVSLEATIYSLVLTDLDGDGRADAVVTNYSQNSVREYPGLASGGFGPARLLLSLSRPSALAVKDLNGDGRPDLLVTTYTDARLRTFLQAADGSFAQSSMSPSLPAPKQLLLADMDGDHVPDAVLLAGSGVGVYHGAGDGSYAFRDSVQVNESAILLGDFNGDGVLDLAAWGNVYDPLIVYLGTGNGSFGPAARFLGYGYVTGAAVADWTGDGIDDLLLSGLYLFPGSTSGITGARRVVPGPSGTVSVAAGDFDGDGHPDIVGAFTDGISVTVGRPGGSFGHGYQISVPGQPTDLALGDLLGDGRTDIAVQIAGLPPLTFYQIYHPLPDGTLRQTAEVSRSQQAASILLEDTNGDGRADLLALLQSPGTLATYFGGADGSLSAPHDLALAGPSPVSFGVAPLDPSSAAPDVAYFQPDYVTNPGGWVRGFVGGLLNDGDGTYGSTATTQSPTPMSAFALGHIDLRNPTFTDALALDANGYLYLYRGTGTAKFQPAVSLGFPGGATGVAVGDFNGDGINDALTWSGTGSTLSIFPGNGDGTFGSRVDVPTTAEISGVAFGDIDGNGTQDIVVTHGTRNSVSILFGDGHGAFGGEEEYFVDPYAYFPRVADINGDGRADIVLGSGSAQVVDVLFQAASAVAVGPKPLPNALGLQLASANPSRGGMTFRMSLPRTAGARLDIFDLHGRLVREYTGLRDAVTWDGRSGNGERASAGVYFARLMLDRNVATTKFVLMN